MFIFLLFLLFLIIIRLVLETRVILLLVPFAISIRIRLCRSLHEPLEVW